MTEPAGRNEDGFTLLELLLAISILVIVVGFASGMIKDQARFSSNISIRQRNFNEARVALQYITRELKNASDPKNVSAVDQLKVLYNGGVPVGIVSWDAVDDVMVNKLVSNTNDSSYRIYYSNNRILLGGETVASNITSFGINEVPANRFVLSVDGDTRPVGSVFEIAVQAGLAPNQYVLKTYVNAVK